jgi:hypothetical protein
LGIEALEKSVFTSWISRSDEFNRNDLQINTLIDATDEKIDDVVEKRPEMDENATEETVDAKVDMVVKREGTRERGRDAALFSVSKKIIQASIWEGDLESDLCVIKYLTDSLSLVPKVDVTDVKKSKKRKSTA